MPDAETTKPDLTGGTSVLGDEAATAAPKADRFAGLRSEAEGLRGEATERFYAFAGTGKDSAAEFIDSYVQTLQDAAAKVEEFAGPQVAQYVHQVADMAGDFSAKLKDSNVDELIEETRVLIRRSPAIAIGAAAGLGFALSRFLKATATHLEPDLAAAKPRKGPDGSPAYDA